MYEKENATMDYARTLADLGESYDPERPVLNLDGTDYVDVPTAARVLGLTRTAVHYRLGHGALRGIRLRGQWLIAVPDLHRALTRPAYVRGREHA